jgi:hypothetical protein
MPYGTSASDFYIRCIKGTATPITDEAKFVLFVKETAVNIVASRNEPTPYEFLLSGLLAEVSGAGYDLDNFDEHIRNVLEESRKDIFVITENTENKAGNLWWFQDPSKYIKHPDRMLTDRVEHSIRSLLLRETSVTLDQVLAEIFTHYPNGLTPDRSSIDAVLRKYAAKSQGKWTITAAAKKEHTLHTEYLEKLIRVARKSGHKAFVGKREQREVIGGKTLAELADLKTVVATKNPEANKRIEMIDMLWLDGTGSVAAAIEVENSTNFTSGIQRASNLDSKLPKIMVIPDKRKSEFLKTKDPLFVTSFEANSWVYITYSEVDKLAGMAKPTLATILKACHSL